MPLFPTVLALLILGTRQVFPQNADAGTTTAPLRAVVLVVARPLGGDGDIDFLRVLATALEIEFMRAGYAVRLLASTASTEQLLAEARTLGTDFLVIEGYTRVGQTLKVEIEVWNAEGGERIASADASRKADLRMDEAVGTAVDKLLPQLEPYVAAVLTRRQAELAAQPPVAVADEVSAEFQPEPAAEAVPSIEPAGPEPSSPEPELPRRLSMELAVGGAPFFPMARMTDLFTMGYLATVYLEYRLNLAGVNLALGGYTGYTGLLPAADGTAAYFRSLIPLGVGIRFGTPDGWPLGLYLRVMAGTAVNISPQVRVDQRLTRVLPQLKAGAGLNVPFSRRTGLAVELLYEVLFYLYMNGGSLATEPVMGFDVPSVYLYTRW